jgi:replicative DNA helicase
VYKQEETDKIMNDIEKRIFDLTQNQTGDTIKPISDFLTERVDEYMAIVDDPNKANEHKVFA